MKRTSTCMVVALATGLALAGCAETGSTVAAGIGPSGAAVQDLGQTDPASMPTYRVNSIAEEYEILRQLGREPQMQALVFDAAGRPYDIIETDQGPVRFDISSFFGTALDG